jgi:hypothetical protein
MSIELRASAIDSASCGDYFAVRVCCEAPTDACAKVSAAADHDDAHEFTAP